MGPVKGFSGAAGAVVQENIVGRGGFSTRCILRAGDLKCLNDGNLNVLTQDGDIGFVLLSMELHMGKGSILYQRCDFFYGRVYKHTHGLYLRRQSLYQLPNGYPD